MKGSYARQRLSLLIATFGMNGSLLVPRDVPPTPTPTPTPASAQVAVPASVPPEPEPEPDPDPDSDSEAEPGASTREPSSPTAEQLSTRVAERNKRSSRGGV